MKVRLLKVVVQPHFVLVDDSGEVEDELVAQPVTVKPREWPTYATTAFVEAMEELEREYAARSPEATPAHFTPDGESSPEA